MGAGADPVTPPFRPPPGGYTASSTCQTQKQKKVRCHFPSARPNVNADTSSLSERYKDLTNKNIAPLRGCIVDLYAIKVSCKVSAFA